MRSIKKKIQGKADASESLVNVSSSSPLRCMLRFKWLGATQRASQDFLTPVEIFESSGSSKPYLRPVEKSEIKTCGSKNSFCRIIFSGRGPFEVRRDVLNRVRMKRTWSQLRLKILFT